MVCVWMVSGAAGEMGLMHEIDGTLDAELAVQRTIKRAELTAFLCLIGPTTVHVDYKKIIDGLWRGEMNWSESKRRRFVDCNLGRIE